jgi:SnoaL-like domain
VGESDFGEWLDAYGRAWEEFDADAGVALFTEDATYQETPFDEPKRGHDAIRALWQESVDTQEDVTFGHEVLSENVARWWCSFTRTPGGKRVELDGIFLCDFADDGRCRAFREWWHAREV